MKSTKIMLAVIASFIITWMSVGLIVFLFSDMTYKESVTNSGTSFLMLFLGWIPAIIVGADLDKSFREY